MVISSESLIKIGSHFQIAFSFYSIEISNLLAPNLFLPLAYLISPNVPVLPNVSILTSSQRNQSLENHLKLK